MLVLVAGVALELGLRGGMANLLVVVGLGAVAVALLLDGRVPRRSGRMLIAASLAPLAWLALRTSPWLTATNVAGAAALFASGVALSRSGRPSDTTLVRLLRRVAGTVPSGWTAPRLLAPLVPDTTGEGSRRLGRVLLAAVLCLPVLAAVVALLAAGDAVFAGFLAVDVDVGPAIGHVVLALLLALVALCTVGAASADTEDRAARGRFGAIEVLTMLAMTATVLALFVVAQLVALTGAGDRLVEQAGLTPAEYARSGFFQLCWATGLILALLAAIRAVAAPEVLRTPAVRSLAAIVPLLATGLVVVSVRRLVLYDQAFGLTMLRLWVLGAAVWMGVALVLVALRNVGVGRGREWVLAGAGAAGLVLVLLANVANPEAAIVRHNADRAADGAELDGAYLATLSDDAVPAIVDLLGRTEDPRVRDELLAAIGCGDDRAGAAALNASARRASEARAEACPSAP